MPVEEHDEIDPAKLDQSPRSTGWRDFDRADAGMAL
jgi:hypothetical protein